MAVLHAMSTFDKPELRSDIDVNVAIDALYGGLYYRFLIPYALLSPKYARALADTVMSGLVQQSR